ncbi:MAG: DUF4214 domain-containing protein [Lachnospiraceae bacterium]|nr:DUF4214 domain-containing protein [Lachnospiraceae bacterium]
MKKKTKRYFYRIISAMMGLIIVIMAFSFDTPHVEAATDFNSFPYGYRAKLKELQTKHPNWTFIPLNTNLEWDDVVKEEMKGNRSLVSITVKDSWKSKEAGDYDEATGTYIGKSGKNWVRASKEGVEYNLNPINYFDEYHIFAFEQLSFNPSIHNVDGVEAIIANSWMSHRPLEDQPNSGFNYSDVFMQNAIDSGVSPYHLASRVLQEQGRGNVESKSNTNPLISGAYGVYNYYNFGASGKTSAEVIANGVVYAEKKGWTTRFLSLSGGASIIGADYINRGQDSLYLQKFDVDNSDGGLYWHQYMQNLQAPMSEAGLTYRAYEGCNALEQNFVFEIPVYKNMPDNEPPASLEKVSQFVTRLYNVCLDRDPDQGGLDDWSNILVNHEKTGSQVSYGFIFSAEFKNKNYCNECYVKHLYNAFLGREYDEEGLKYWINELETGKTREYVFNGFVLSKEFGSICEDYGIDRGAGITVPEYGTIAKGKCAGCGVDDDVTLFVTRLYNVCLDREPDEEGLKNHCEGLWNRSTSATQVAYNFIFSQEFKNRGFDDSTYVDYLYRAFMDREADEGGKNDWVNRLANGTSREDVFKGFAGSQEFKNLCNKYGIKN